MDVEGIEVSKLRLITHRGEEQKLIGECSGVTAKQYLYVEFYQNQTVRGRAMVEVGNGVVRSLDKYPIILERGLYEVSIQRIFDGNRMSDVKKWYPVYLMAGRPYDVNILLQPTVMYGVPGTLVQVETTEIQLNVKDLYYRVNKADDVYSIVKYYVPITGNYSSFFVENLEPREISFPADQNPALKLNIAYQ